MTPFQHDQFILSKSDCDCHCDTCQIFCEHASKRSEVIRRRKADMRALGLCPDKLEVQAGLGEFHGPWLPPAGGWRLETLEDVTIAHIPRTQTPHTEMVEPINSQPINLSYLYFLPHIQSQDFVMALPILSSPCRLCWLLLNGCYNYFVYNI